MCVLCVLIAIYMICHIFSILLVAAYNHRQSVKDFVTLNGEGGFKEHAVVSLEKGKDKLFKKQFSAFVSGLNKWVCHFMAKIPSHTVRNFVLRKVLYVKMEEDVVVYSGTIMRGTYRIKIGQGTIVGDDCMLDGRGHLNIGKNCNLSTGVKIWTAQHDVQSPIFAYTSAPVDIKDRCWISGGATILPGITVGEGCVIASGAVVTKDCEPYGIYAGIPAKRIGERNQNLQYQFDGRHDWFL